MSILRASLSRNKPLTIYPADDLKTPPLLNHPPTGASLKPTLLRGAPGLFPNLPHRATHAPDLHIGPTSPHGEPSYYDFETLSKNAPPTHKKRAPKTAHDAPGVHPLGHEPPGDRDAFTFPDDPLCDLPVPGRLRDSADFWRNELHASESVINNITKGWPVPWTASEDNRGPQSGSQKTLTKKPVT